ncbi:hypothetical protein Tco_0657636 [Tanacetum coccineum]
MILAAQKEASDESAGLLRWSIIRRLGLLQQPGFANGNGKVANFVNTKSQIRHSFLKHQLQEYGRAALLRVPFCCRGGGGGGVGRVEFEPVFEMVEDVLSSARALQLVFLDESYKMMTMDDQIGKEIMGNDEVSVLE